MLVIILAMTLCGCFGQDRIIVKTQIVKVPVAIPAEAPPEFEKVTQPVELITQASTDAEVTKAYFDSLTMCRADLVKRDNILDTYRTHTPSQ